MASDRERQPLLGGTLANAERYQGSFSRNYRAFLLYSAASEIFVLVALGIFLPLTLQQYAFANGRIGKDHARPCTEDDSAARCQVNLFGYWIGASSFPLYTFSASVLCQAVMLVTLSSYANHPGTRKTTLFTNAFVGATATILFLFVRPTSPLWMVCALFGLIGNVCFGLASVCLNSYLPALAAGTETVQTARLAVIDAQDEAQKEQLSIEYKAVLARATGHISATGVAIGYATGTLGLLLSLVPVKMLHNSLWSLRIVVGSAGGLWLLLSIPAAILLEQPTLITDDALNTTARLMDGWRKLFLIVKAATELKQTFLFLMSWFFLSDAFATITSSAVLFARTEVHMTSGEVVLLGIIVPTLGVVGALIVPKLAAYFRSTNLQTFVCICTFSLLLPLYGTLGFVPAVKKAGIATLKTKGEMYGLATVLGLSYGGFSAYARTVYSALIPPGDEARFFSLYAITDKSSSFLGPLLVGLASDAFGTLRVAFVIIFIGIALSIPLLLSIDMDDGQRAAQAYAVTSRNKQTGQDAVEG